MKCVCCGERVNKTYRVNQRGDYFCGDECYEKYGEISDRSAEDHFHPSIDTYENIRSEYIYWEKNWESILEDFDNFLTEDRVSNIHDIVDPISNFIDEHFEYYISDGDDGIFHYEMRRFLHELRELQIKVINWRPEREPFFTLGMIFSKEAAFQVENDFDSVEDLQVFVERQHMDQKELLLHAISVGANPNEWRSSFDNNVRLTYDSLEEAEEAADLFRILFTEREMEIYIDETYTCDSGCGIFLAVDEAESDLDGWHYEQLCEDHDLPGIYSKDELSNIVEQDGAKYLGYDWWFKAKVRRSCIVHGINCPHWALDEQ